MTAITLPTVDIDQTATTFAEAYLRQFSNLHEQTGDITSLIRGAQRVLRVSDDGVIGPQTVKAMRTAPRCGCADTFRVGGVVNQWDRRLATGSGITYAVQRYTTQLGGLTQADQDDLLDLAFRQWTDVCGIVFKRIRRAADANIVISSSNSTREEFGQEFGVLAWCELPQGAAFAGQVRLKFDDSERWIREGNVGIRYLNVACHEIGHGIGLDHDPDVRDAAIALMDPMYSPDVGRPMPHFDVPQAVQRYGAAVLLPGGPAPEPNDGLESLTRKLAAGYRQQAATYTSLADALERS